MKNEPVAWMVEENVVMREDFAALLGFNGSIVGTGRAIPHSWKPFLYTAPQPAQSKDAEDAARYRWLRDTAIYIDPVQKILRISNVYIKKDGSIPISFDDAIDEAMRGEK